MKILLFNGDIEAQSTCGKHRDCCRYDSNCAANWSYSGPGKPLKMSCNC